MGLFQLLLCICVVRVGCESSTSVATPNKPTSPTSPTSRIPSGTTDSAPTITTETMKSVTTTPTTTILPMTTYIPADVDNVTVTGQNETSVTLLWKKVEGRVTDYILNSTNGPNTTCPANQTNTTNVTCTVSSLTPGTKYEFTLFTVFGNVNSKGRPFSAVTAPINVANVSVTEQNETSVTLLWNKVTGEGISYQLQFSNGTIVTIVGSDTQITVTYTVSPLEAGSKYNLTLFTVFENIRSSGSTNFLAITRPLSVADVKVTGQNESSITLQWNTVNGSGITYNLQVNNGTHIIITSETTYTISNLTAGEKYNLTVFAVFENVRSFGKELSTVTAPRNVVNFHETNRNITSVTLSWTRPENGVTSYMLNFTDKQNTIIDGTQMSYTVSHLQAGKRYDFILFTVFEDIKSSGKHFFTVTRIFCPGLTWVVTNSSIKAELFSYDTVAYGTVNNENHTVRPEKDRTLTFTNLNPGSTYDVTLWFNNTTVKLELCKHNEIVVPPDLKDLTCNYLSGGYAFSLSWDAPKGLWTSVQVNVTGKSTNTIEGKHVKNAEITGVQPAQTYHMTLASISGHRRSNAVSFSCQTDPRGVISGSVMAVVLLCILVCLAFVIWRRKPTMFSRPKSMFMESKLAKDKYKPIPLGKFPDHYQRMSADMNRGFSEEYEDFLNVGKEQTQRAAELEENRSKNRFSNVLPYDWCRVKLMMLNHDPSSDYINANYMPGYGNSRQYIAAQGPLPNTVNDFWRMIWEQRVNGVVMVTNCIEGGKAKCEQYWPLDYTPCLYGDLLVTVSSEKRETSWTLREFVVKNRNVSEERLVKHFHFTAWPDHGVPDGTQALIQFRGLVRHYIEDQPYTGPTVVHCSAGVGRTGTIITLDVILQQLERERVVGIAAFVHKLRLSRPLMVQTEPQYIFLHQCIMDSLEPEEKMPQEPLYENTDMIYVNATALREFQTANPKI